MTSTADVSLDALLEMAKKNPDALREIKQRYGAKVAVLVVEFSVNRRGMDSFSRVSKLRTTGRAARHYTPAVVDRGGQIVKTPSDTVVGVFAQASDALLAALDGHARMKEFNGSSISDIWAGLPGDPIHPRAGLGFGPSPFLALGELDGQDIHRAYVLGTEVARSKEILASRAFVEELGEPPVGVGLRGSRCEREAEVGFPFHIYTDYRMDDD